MSSYDNPNQEVVRGFGPGVEAGSSKAPVTEAPSGEDYAAMTKAQLIELAQARGISPANNDMTKDELIAALEAD